MVSVRHCGKIQLTCLENIWELVLQQKEKYSRKKIILFIFVMLIMLSNISERIFKCYWIYHASGNFSSIQLCSFLPCKDINAMINALVHMLPLIVTDIHRGLSTLT